jgi:hypothetical protein
MSLTTLTFGSANSTNANSHAGGKIKVIKSEKFVGMDALCVIARLVDGAIAKKMRVMGKSGTQVLSVESKSGDGLCTKPGAQVVLMVEGLAKEEAPAGAEILFEKCTEEACKPKGKVIVA